VTRAGHCYLSIDPALLVVGGLSAGFVAERSSGIDGVGDPLVAIGIARSRPVETIALQECDRAPVARFRGTALVSLCEPSSTVLASWKGSCVSDRRASTFPGR
jgi:hypothetical protein